MRSLPFPTGRRPSPVAPWPRAAGTRRPGHIYLVRPSCSRRIGPPSSGPLRARRKARPNAGARALDAGVSPASRGGAAARPVRGPSGRSERPIVERRISSRRRGPRPIEQDGQDGEHEDGHPEEHDHPERRGDRPCDGATSPEGRRVDRQVARDRRDPGRVGERHTHRVFARVRIGVRGVLTAPAVPSPNAQESLGGPEPPISIAWNVQERSPPVPALAEIRTMG